MEGLACYVSCFSHRLLKWKHSVPVQCWGTCRFGPETETITNLDVIPDPEAQFPEFGQILGYLPDLPTHQQIITKFSLEHVISGPLN